MGKKAWIIFSVICVLVVVAALVLMLVLVPQVKYSIQAGEYNNISKQEYTFTGDNSKLEQEYTITSKDVENGKKTDKYDEGNINPFTPKSEVTIYNEPTLNYEGSGNSNDNNKG